MPHIPHATPMANLHEEDRQQNNPRRPTMMVSPHLRQDWEEHEDHAPAVWEELLFDLVFVSAAIQLSGFMKKDPSAEQIATAMILFFLLWGFWLDYWWLKTRFKARDSLSRALFFIYTSAIALSVFFMQEGMDLKDSVTAMWSVALLALCIWYLYLSVWVPRARSHIKHLLLGYCMQFLFWSFTYIASDRATRFLWVTGLICSYCCKTLTFLGPYADDRLGSPLARIPINLHHTAERFGLWIVIILGEVVIACTTAAHKKDVRFEQTIMIVFTMMLVLIMCFRYNKVQPTRLRYHSLVCGKFGRVEGYMLGHWVMTAAFLVLATGIKLMFYHLPAGDDEYAYAGGHKLLASPSYYPPPDGYGNETDHHDDHADHDDSTYAECEDRENSSHHCLEEKDVELVCRSLAVVSISMNFIRIGHAQPHSWTASGIGAWVLRLSFIAAEWYLPNFGVDTLHTQSFVLMVLTLLQLVQLAVDLAQDVYNFYLEQQLMAGSNDGGESNWRRRVSMLMVSVSGQPTLMCESSTRGSSHSSIMNVPRDHDVRFSEKTDDGPAGPLPRMSIRKKPSQRQRDWSIGHYDEIEPFAQQYVTSPSRHGLDASPASVHGGVPTSRVSGKSVAFK
ncbi:hypothetical protein CYMTET_6982 [Cymbomonas tetramitiformis]|uniref:Low temperature requirement A n=1 Tax=Cymbomonas tetramitiformis TaxID=36881 RepID=A0AAE0GWI5_9CHLO|nr:hypothetical protein CYMTET_6982 [Cymbomonas tetramitiformis]